MTSAVVWILFVATLSNPTEWDTHSVYPSSGLCEAQKLIKENDYKHSFKFECHPYMPVENRERP